MKMAESCLHLKGADASKQSLTICCQFDHLPATVLRGAGMPENAMDRAEECRELTHTQKENACSSRSMVACFRHLGNAITDLDICQADVPDARDVCQGAVHSGQNCSLLLRGQWSTQVSPSQIQSCQRCGQCWGRRRLQCRARSQEMLHLEAQHTSWR